MAKFCIHCGSELEEGIICNCPGAIQERKQNTGSQAQSGTVAKGQNTAINIDTAKIKTAYFAGLADLKNFIAAPISTAQDLANDASFSRSGSLIAFLAVISGLMLYLPLRSGGRSSDFDLFFYPFLAVVASSLAMAFLLTTFAKMYKIEIPFVNTVSIVAAASIPCTIAWSIILVMLLVFGAGLASDFFAAIMAMLIIGSMAAACCIIYNLIQGYLPDNASGAFLIVTFSNMAFIFAAVIIVKAVAQKMITNAFNMLF